MEVSATWRIVGVVAERRELKSEKASAKDWRGYVVKVMTLGATFEITVTHDQFDKVGDGEPVEMVGRFEQRPTDKGGIMTKFIATGVSHQGKAVPRG